MPQPGIEPTTVRISGIKPVKLEWAAEAAVVCRTIHVLLKCLSSNWELHRPYLQKSETLAEKIKNAEDPKPQVYYKSPASETLDKYIEDSEYYSNEYQEISKRLSVLDEDDRQKKKKKGLDHPAHVSEARVNDVTVIELEVHDDSISKRALAVALGNLYHDDLEVEVNDVAVVLAAASLLGYKALVEECSNVMLKSINSRTICPYYSAATRYHQDHVVTACEGWLELNLIPELSCQIHLRELPSDLLQKIVKSNRLFTTNEYSVYKTLVYWLFLQMNSSLQLMPTHSTVLSYFNSMDKSSSLLEKEPGQDYSPLFGSLKVHGILETSHIQDMQMMNILPQRVLIEILSGHYHALQGGGDMSALNHFHEGAIRQGFIMDEEPQYHSEIMSVHGFHFELKAVKKSIEGTYNFYMHRLRPADPILSFRQCERHTFSLRPDREVRYSITVQCRKNNQHQYHSTGILSQKFGLGEKISRSEVLALEKLEMPLYVTFALMFPSS